MSRARQDLTAAPAAPLDPPTTHAPARAILALVLALLSVPGSLLTRDTLPGGGFVFGLPFAIAAILVGIQARRHAETGRGKALAAILIGGAMVAMMAVWTIAESL